MPAIATDRLFGLTTSVAVKAPCHAVATSNITLAGLQTVNGVSVIEGDRVLVTAQSNLVDNGIYLASTSSWQRAPDFDGARDAVQGTQIPIARNGAQTALYEVATANPIVFGTTAIAFTLRYSANLQYDISSAEISAGVTPVNYVYPPGIDLRYGVIRDDSTDNQTALSNLILVGAQGVQIILTPGIARHSGTLNWSHDNLRVRAEGKSQLRHTGAGVANLIDGGVSGTVWNVNFEGYIEELGSATTTYCWDTRSLGRCRLDLRAKNCTVAGMRIRFAVLCVIRYALTGNDPIPITTEPVYGLVLTERDPGEQVAGCLFPNLFLEGLTANTGLQLASCFDCKFDAGSSEGCRVGVEVNGSSNYNNTFVNFDYESNTVSDVTVSGGQGLTFINCRSTSNVSPGPNIALTGGDSTTFYGGFYRWVDCLGGAATNTRFFGVQVPDSNTVGITGTGSKKIIGAVKVDTVQVPVIPPTTGPVYDQVGDTLAFPTAPTIFGGTTPGTQTYSTQSGTFTLVGRLCYFSITLILTANSGGTGTATVSLPFTSANFLQSVPISDYTGVTLGAAGRALSLRIAAGGATGALLETDTGSVSNFIAIGSISTTAFLCISGSYMVA